ncbi:MATE family efflux transporter [Eubacterium aggregans]|uniref:MATE family efflux transporter n=1 Tax=Eubacterium aggregans TaxID=81409 RepID=UPI003F3E0764
MMEQFLTVLVEMADSIMIASVVEAAVSGVSLLDNVFILILQVLTALATGGDVVIGQYLGSRSAGEARRAAE